MAGGACEQCVRAAKRDNHATELSSPPTDYHLHARCVYYDDAKPSGCMEDT